MTPPANNGNGNGNGRGPPPWAGPPVNEQDDGTVSVGRNPREDARQRAKSADTQMDRLEAKLDYLITLMEG